MTGEIIPLFAPPTAFKPEAVDEPLSTIDITRRALLGQGCSAHMAEWIAAEFAERNAAVDALTLPVSSFSVSWNATALGGREASAKLRDELQGHFMAATAAWRDACGAQLIELLVRLYFALHPPAPGGGRKVA
jgi:hypothetical protein